MYDVLTFIKEFDFMQLTKAKKQLIVICFITVVSFFSVYFIFYHHYFKLGYDGPVHLARLEAVTQAIKHRRLVPLVNFIGFSGNGSIFNAMYPWITSLIFIIPHVLIHNPMIALFIGFFLTSFITMFNCYAMLRSFTSRLSIQLLGITIYQLNLYHLIDMYSRSAWGEFLAYAFIPLIILGCKFIWNNKMIPGILILALGMGLVINSHVLSAMLAFFLILGFEFVRIFKRTIKLKELLSLIASGVLALLISIYSVTNILAILLNNRLFTPNKRLDPINLSDFIQDSLSNNLGINPASVNIGLFPFTLLILLGLFALFINKGTWQKWIIAAWLLFFLTLNWIPYEAFNLQNSVLANIQFLSRLLNFVILFLVVGTSIFLDQQKIIKLPLQRFCMYLTILVSISGFLSILSYYNLPAQLPQSYIINNNNYYNYTNGSNAAESDYVQNINGKRATELFNCRGENYSQSFDNERFIVKGTGIKNVPFLLFNGIHYNIKVNNQRIKPSYHQGVLRIKLNKEVNHIAISVNPTRVNYISFFISIISIFFTGISICKWKLNRKDKYLKS